MQYFVVSIRTTTFKLPDYRGAFLRGYGTGTNASTDVPSWCTSGEIGSVAQQPAIPNITGGFGNGGRAARVDSTGAFYIVSTFNQGNRDSSGDQGAKNFGFDASRSDTSYGRRVRDIAPFNYAVQFFIKF